jgi:protein SCO1/2
MKYHEKLMIFAILLGAVATASGAGRSYAMDEHHHHHHAMSQPDAGYQRSAASYSIPDVSLVDMDGKPVSLRDGLGGDEPVLLNFIFTSCTAICPAMSATFMQVQEKLGEEVGGVRMVSISIDPENDTPERLKEYAERFHAGAQWKMLTGSAEDSIAVQRAFDAYRGGKMNHAPVTFLRAGGADQSWVRLDGLASASDIVDEYRKLAAH